MVQILERGIESQLDGQSSCTCVPHIHDTYIIHVHDIRTHTCDVHVHPEGDLRTFDGDFQVRM